MKRRRDLRGTRACIGPVTEESYENFLRDFNSKVGTEVIFKQTTGNKNLLEISNDNEVLS